jgi:hypothetical protein
MSRSSWDARADQQLEYWGSRKLRTWEMPPEHSRMRAVSQAAQKDKGRRLLNRSKIRFFFIELNRQRAIV